MTAVRRRLGHRSTRRARAFLTLWCEALGPTFIKMGQILSCRPDLIGRRCAESLRRLQDDVSPLEFSVVSRLIEDSLGRGLYEAFEWFDPVPLSSASVAVVHLAGLRNGRTVAVKILRPGLSEVVHSDVEAMRRIAGWLERVPAWRDVPLRNTIDELAAIIAGQLDLRAEAENNRRFRRNFSGHAVVRIPALVDELCTASVLTMEYFPGLRRVDELQPSSVAAAGIARQSLHAIFQMIFSDGFIHADMHPGNLLLREDGTLALLDAGFVADLNSDDQRDFASFFFGMVSNRGRECARILQKTASSVSARFQGAAFDAEVAALVDRHFAKTARDFEVTAFAAQLFLIMGRHGLRGSTRFVTTILSLIVFEGIAKQIDPALDFQAEARQHIPVVMRALLKPASRPASSCA
jgi:ubiquinone biosynthesis protein